VARAGRHVSMVRWPAPTRPVSCLRPRASEDALSAAARTAGATLLRQYASRFGLALEDVRLACFTTETEDEAAVGAKGGPVWTTGGTAPRWMVKMIEEGQP
jgi:hypothetical protein